MTAFFICFKDQSELVGEGHERYYWKVEVSISAIGYSIIAESERYPGISQPVRDCWQITSVTLNGFCSLISNPPSPPVFLTDKIKMDGIPTKSNEKYKHFLNCIWSFESTSHNNLDAATRSFISCCFILDFISA